VDRNDELGSAEAQAELMLEAGAASVGAADGERVARNYAVVLRRIIGPQEARQCGHLTEHPELVYLHSAVGIHQCQACISSEETYAQIVRHRPTICDSCGEAAAVLDQAQFTVRNIVVTPYLCSECRGNPSRATMPERT